MSRSTAAELLPEPDLRPPALSEFWRAGVNRGSYPGTDSATCLLGCTRASTWRFILGDASEHVARLNYCDEHAILVASAPRLECQAAGCGKAMRIEIREKMTR